MEIENLYVFKHVFNRDLLTLEAANVEKINYIYFDIINNNTVQFLKSIRIRILKHKTTKFALLKSA